MLVAYYAGVELNGNTKAVREAVARALMRSPALTTAGDAAGIPRMRLDRAYPRCAHLRENPVGHEPALRFLFSASQPLTRPPGRGVTGDAQGTGPRTPVIVCSRC